MSNITQKIKTLLAKAASTTFEAEADALMVKARALMEEHQISAWQLGGSDDPIGMTLGAQGQSGPSSYKPKLQAQLAALYGCRAIQSMGYLKDANGCLRYGKTGRLIEGFVMELIGAESARITTELMTEYVWDQVNVQAKKLAKEYGHDKGHMVRMITNALMIRIARLVAEKKRAEAKVEANTATGKNALVIIASATDAFVNEMFSDLRTIKAKPITSNRAAHAAAAGISLNTQVGGAKAGALRIGK
jgi:hypothetical protein